VPRFQRSTSPWVLASSSAASPSGVPRQHAGSLTVEDGLQQQLVGGRGLTGELGVVALGQVDAEDEAVVRRAGQGGVEESIEITWKRTYGHGNVGRSYGSVCDNILVYPLSFAVSALVARW
jgi:hypothetical protein